MTLLEAAHQAPVLVPIAIRLTITFVDCKCHGIIHKALHKLHDHGHKKPTWVNSSITGEILLVLLMGLIGYTLDAGIEHLLPEPEKVEAVAISSKE